MSYTLNLAFKHAYSVVIQHLDDLEEEAESKGGIEQVLADHFARVYKVAMSYVGCITTG